MYPFTKILFDKVAAVTLLAFLLPALLLLAVLVRVFLGRPVIYRQQRPGLHGKLFCMYKFRTLTNETDAAGVLLPHYKRVTKFGNWLRKTSLDELPELLNVLNGEMSLVGPRPLLAEYLPLYSVAQARRHQVKPGITGWAQVNGRNGISWEQKFNFDIWYVDNRSFILDLKILYYTLRKVIRQDGVNASEEETMPPFRGTANAPTAVATSHQEKI
ncbi:sugar transferase [Pontibacter sp. CAU 1760]